MRIKKEGKVFVAVDEETKISAKGRTRKEAEVLSIKLKNSEGLRTFVTFVMQEGAIRQQ